MAVLAAFVFRAIVFAGVDQPRRQRIDQDTAGFEINIRHGGQRERNHHRLPALVAQLQKIAAAEGDTSFYEAKLMTAKFYYERLLPRTLSHKQALLSGSDNLMTMPEDLFDVAG